MKKLNSFVALLVFTIMAISCFGDIETTYDYSYKKVKETSGSYSWIFEGKSKPPVNLIDNDAFLNDINRALDSLGFPNVDKVVVEKEKLTGSRYDRAIFEWTDYELGVLRITRSTCKDANYQMYDCLWKVTLDDR